MQACLKVIAVLMVASPAFAQEVGELERLPKDLLQAYPCGQYFRGELEPGGDRTVYFGVKPKKFGLIGPQGMVTAVFLVSKKSVEVILDESKKVPVAIVRFAADQKKVELRMSAADLRGAPCLAQGKSTPM